jgi:hypothetical protein
MQESGNPNQEVVHERVKIATDWCLAEGIFNVQDLKGDDWKDWEDLLAHLKTHEDLEVKRKEAGKMREALENCGFSIKIEKLCFRLELSGDPQLFTEADIRATEEELSKLCGEAVRLERTQSLVVWASLAAYRKFQEKLAVEDPRAQTPERRAQSPEPRAESPEPRNGSFPG